MLPIESALVVLVPQAEHLVRPFREKYDPSAAAGMPSHITVLYPFKPPHEITQTVLGTLSHCFAQFEIFDFSLIAIRRFQSEVLFLGPEPDEPFRRLTLAVWRCFPETPPYRGRYSGTVPHLTIAQPADADQLDRIAGEFEHASYGKLPLNLTAEEVTLLDTCAGSWQVRAAFPLG